LGSTNNHFENDTSSTPISHPLQPISVVNSAGIARNVEERVARTTDEEYSHPQFSGKEFNLQNTYAGFLPKTVYDVADLSKSSLRHHSLDSIPFLSRTVNPPWISLAAVALDATRDRHGSQGPESTQKDMDARTRLIREQYPVFTQAAITLGDKNPHINWIAFALKDHFCENHTWIVVALHGTCTPQMFLSARELRNYLRYCPLSIIRSALSGNSSKYYKDRCTLMVVGEGPFGNLAHILLNECQAPLEGRLTLNKGYSISFSPLPLLSMDKDGWLGMQNEPASLKSNFSVYQLSDTFTQTVALVDKKGERERLDLFTALSAHFNSRDDKGIRDVYLKALPKSSVLKVDKAYFPDFKGEYFIIPNPPSNFAGSKFTQALGTLPFLCDIVSMANHLSPERFKIVAEERKTLELEFCEPAEVHLAIIFVPFGTFQRQHKPKRVSMKVMGKHLTSLNLNKVVLHNSDDESGPSAGIITCFHAFMDPHSIELEVEVSDWNSLKKLSYNSYSPTSNPSNVPIVIAERANGIASDLDLPALLTSAAGKVVVEGLSTGRCGRGLAYTEIGDVPVMNAYHSVAASIQKSTQTVDAILSETILSKNASKNCATTAFQRLTQDSVNIILSTTISELDSKNDMWFRWGLIGLGVFVIAGVLSAPFLGIVALSNVAIGSGIFGGGAVALSANYFLQAKKYRAYTGKIVDLLVTVKDDRNILQMLEDQEKRIVQELSTHQNKCGESCVCFPSLEGDEKKRKVLLDLIEKLYKPIYELRLALNQCILITLVGPKNSGKTKALHTILKLPAEQRVKSPLGDNVADSTDRLFVCRIKPPGGPSLLFVDPPGVTESDHDLRLITKLFVDVTDFALIIASKDVASAKDKLAHESQRRDFQILFEILLKLSSHVRLRMVYTKYDQGYNEFLERNDRQLELLNHNENSQIPQELRYRIGEPKLTSFENIKKDEWDLDTPEDVHAEVFQFVAERLTEQQTYSLNAEISAGSGLLFDEPPYRMSQKIRLVEIQRVLKLAHKRGSKLVESVSVLLLEAEEAELLKEEALVLFDEFRDTRSKPLRQLSKVEVAGLLDKLEKLIGKDEGNALPTPVASPVAKSGWWWS
ncbi:UNVERIFIED_CONTAM: hypothetical protein HDU68_005753, partial [Siphonaria sp. JEL0065]